MADADSHRAAKASAVSTVSKLGGALFLLAMIGLGVAGLLAGDFAYQWQPVSKDLPARASFARVAGALLIVIALASAHPRTRWFGWPLLAVYLGKWVLLTHGISVVRQPSSLAAWLGVAEIGAMFVAALATCAVLLSWPRRGVILRAFGLAPIIFGLAHFGYPEITASMVPGWIPFPLFWAYATGIAHLAGGLAIVAGIATRWAALALGGMYGSWVVLLHAPRVIAAPSNRVEWTMLFVAIGLSGSAFLISSGSDRAFGRGKL